MTIKNSEKEIGWLIKEKYKGELTLSNGLRPKSEGFYLTGLTKELGKDIKRLEKGEPIDYLIGFVDFLGCKIDLSKKPFIPRPETEYWAERAIEDIKSNKRKIHCLDVFSGSGCIGIAVLKTCPELCQKIDFIEKDKKAIVQIKINLKLNKIKPGRYEIIQSDIFKEINPVRSPSCLHDGSRLRRLTSNGVKGKPRTIFRRDTSGKRTIQKMVRGKYDYIFANPPYVAKSRKNLAAKSVLKFEPRGSIFGGKDGLFYIKKFLKDAKNHLKKGGKIYMEFDFQQKKEITELLKVFCCLNYKFQRDQYGRWRYLVIN